ncbi:MAG: 30S ribosomal protein S18 [Candidatus Omnitrophota bacterium]
MRFKTTRTKITKRKDSRFLTRKKFCRFCVDKTKAIDYKDTRRIESFVTERGKLMSSRVSGNCAKHQRLLVEAMRKARFLSLIPYTR